MNEKVSLYNAAVYTVADAFIWQSRQGHTHALIQIINYGNRPYSELVNDHCVGGSNSKWLLL